MRQWFQLPANFQNTFTNLLSITVITVISNTLENWRPAWKYLGKGLADRDGAYGTNTRWKRVRREAGYAGCVFAFAD